jgi:hypothetical protein
MQNFLPVRKFYFSDPQLDGGITKDTPRYFIIYEAEHFTDPASPAGR